MGAEKEGGGEATDDAAVENDYDGEWRVEGLGVGVWEDALVGVTR